jgi:hypothetical protein
MLTGTRVVLSAREATMISVAVKGYGVVIWDGSDHWRTFGASDVRTALLSARVDTALRTVRSFADHDVLDALLSISGAELLAMGPECSEGLCEHGSDHRTDLRRDLRPDGDVNLN